MDNVKAKEDICNYIKEGMFKKDAALMSGIDESTLYRWIEADASFASRIEASILEYKHTLIKKLNVSTEKDGRLALEVLKRRFPKEWNADPNRQEPEEREERFKTMKGLTESFQKLLQLSSSKTETDDVEEGEIRLLTETE